MLNVFDVPLVGPTLNSVLFWNGRLMMLARGFCDFLASSLFRSSSL